MSGILKWEAHVDWLTLTIRDKQEESARVQWAQSIKNLVDQAGGGENTRREARLGYYGSTTGPVFRGERYDGCMVVVSGPAGDLASRQTWPEAARCSRIDLCVTCWYSEPQPHLAKSVCREVAAARLAGAPGHARKITLIDGYGDGDTLYIGSRQSDQFARLYDKEKESGSGEYVNSWRWEVEYKGKAARQVFKGIRSASVRIDTIAATVDEWFTRRGASRGPGVAALGAIRVECPRTETTDSSKLAWLARAVAPTVAGLLTRVGYDATLEALGLLDLAQDDTEVPGYKESVQKG